MKHLSWFLFACGAPAPEPVVMDSPPPPAPTTPTAETDEPDEPPDSACGDVTLHNLTIVGRVRGVNGAAAEGANVVLEERNYFPTLTVMGKGVTDATGTFQFDVVDLVAVEDCWGVLVDYVIVAERGKERGEEGINPSLSNAVYTGSSTVDLTSLPVVMELTN